MRNTELRQVRHVVELGRYLSFTRAARALGITQSALTRSIQTIEQRAGTQLFDRDRGRVRLTEVGKSYFARAEALLQDAQDLDRLLEQTAAGDGGKVNYGMTSAIARALLPQILVDELADRPGLQETIAVSTPALMIERVQNETMEFCLCGEQEVPPAGLRSTIIGSLPLGLVVRKGHSASSEPPMLDLTAFPLILSGQASDADRIPQMVHPVRLAPPSIVLDDLSILSHIVTHSDAIWLTSTGAAAGELRSDSVRELPLPANVDLRFRVVMYSHARRTLSPVARRLADLMRAQAARWNSGQ